MAVSYRPTSVPSGPLMRCNSSWMMRSGGRSGFCGSTLAEGDIPLGPVDAADLQFLRRLGQTGRPEAVPLAEAVHLPKEHLHRAVPRHLGELVHRGNQQRRQAAVNFLVHHHHRQPLARRFLHRELALPELGPAVDQRAAGPLAVLLDLDVLAGVDLRPAPRAVSQLVRRPDAAELLPTSACRRGPTSLLRRHRWSSWASCCRRPTDRCGTASYPSGCRRCSGPCGECPRRRRSGAAARWNCWSVRSRSVYRISTVMPFSPERPSTVPCSRRRPSV